MYVCSFNSHAPISKVSKYAYYPQVNIKLQILVQTYNIPTYMQAYIHINIYMGIYMNGKIVSVKHKLLYAYITYI